jgi:hypothetical protein
MGMSWQGCRQPPLREPKPWQTKTAVVEVVRMERMRAAVGSCILVGVVGVGVEMFFRSLGRGR